MRFATRLSAVLALVGACFAGSARAACPYDYNCFNGSFGASDPTRRGGPATFGTPYAWPNPSTMPPRTDRNGRSPENPSAQPYGANSLSNPYSRFNNPYSPDGLDNPYGRYGNPYSRDYIKNPYGRYRNPYSADRIEGGSRFADPAPPYGSKARAQEPGGAPASESGQTSFPSAPKRE